jgi:hypothetical protein
VVKRFNPKDFGLPVTLPNADIPTVLPLPKLPHSRKEFTKSEAAWKAYDAAMVVSDGDRVLADRVYQAVINQKRSRNDDEHSQDSDVGKSVGEKS